MKHHIRSTVRARAIPARGQTGLGPIPALWLTMAVALLISAALLTAMPAGATAATAGPHYPGTAASVDGPGYAAWTNPGYITADDTSYATSYVPQYAGQDSSEDLQGTNYGFSIPLDATINGITVTIARYSGYYWLQVLNDQDLYLLKSGAKVGTDHASGSNWPTSLGTATYGGTTDLWGTNWAPAEINASDFGVSLSVYNPSSGSGLTAHVDYIRVTVAYTPAALAISTTSPLPNGAVGTAYSQTLTASGGTPSYTWSIDSGSLPAGLTLDGATGAITGTPTAAGGPTSITYRVTDSNAVSTTKALSITIGKGTPTLTWADPADITYGTALSSTQLCATASMAGTFVYTPASGTMLSAGSGQTLHVVFTPTDAANYNTASADVAIDVNPRVLTVTAENKSKVYGAADPALTYTYSPALVGGDSFSGALSRSAGESTGSHAITQGTLSLSGNYSLSYTGATLTITPKALTITASDRGKNYGDTVTFAGTEFTAAGLINSDTVTSVVLTSAGADTWAPIGTYPIVPSGASGTGLSNYSITYQDGTLTVSALTLTVTANNRSKTYGEAVSFAGNEFTVSGLLAGDSVDSVTLASAGAGAAGAAGTWDIVPSGAVGSGLAKYTITYVNGTLTVSTRALTITSSDLAKTQGETLVFEGDEFTAMGLVNSDAVTSVTLFSDGAAASATNGEYTILASGAVGTGLANYSITYVNGKLTVSTYGLTITASSGSKTYGDTFTLAGTEFTVSGLLAGDSVDSVTLTSAGAGATAAAGAYTIVPGNATGTGLAKYTIVYANGILIVSPRAITITADNATKTYGDTLAFAGTEFTVSGLVNSDTVDSVTLTSAGAGATAAAGAFTIVPGNAAGTGLGNYSITYTNGTLTVGPRPLAITANNRSKTHGSTVTFAGTEFVAVGLVNSDSVTAVTLTSAGAGAGATAGTYDIVPSGATGSGLENYAVTYTNGTLTVGKAGVIWTVTSSPASSAPGSPVILTATVNNTDATGTVTFMDGGAVLGTGTLNNGVATFTTSGLSVGSHYITVSYDGDTNFADGSSLAHIHTVKAQAEFNWWWIIIGGAAAGGFFFFLVLYRRRKRKEQEGKA